MTTANPTSLVPSFQVPGLTRRFWAKVRITDGCWLWTASLSPAGYGRINVGQKPLYAHRLMYEAYFGVSPRGLYVCHHCDNPPCVNPNHLFLGTCADNSHDAVVKNRIGGVKHGMAKLSLNDVMAIRQRYANGGITQLELAEEYGISDGHVCSIIKRKFWSRGL